MWPDQNSGVVEQGWVAVRIQIQHFNGSTWSVVKVGSVTKLKAWDNKWTQFPSKTLSWGGPNNHKYRAGVVVKFIKTDGSTEGRASYIIDNHRRLYDNSVGAACVGRHPNVG